MSLSISSRIARLPTVDADKQRWNIADMTIRQAQTIGGRLLAALLTVQLLFLRFHLHTEHHHLGASPRHDAASATLTDPHVWTVEESGHAPHHAIEHQISMAERPRPVAFVQPALSAHPMELLRIPVHVVHFQVHPEGGPPVEPHISPQGARAPPIV